MLDAAKENRYLTLIGILSVVVPLLVAVLLFSPTKFTVGSDWVYFLPHLNAVLNTATAIALVAGLIFIRNKKIKYHKTSMNVAFTLGCLFLVSYVIYHSSATSTVFGDLDKNGIVDADEAIVIGGMRSVYLTILISHIILAAIVVPFVLLAMYYGLTKKYASHRKVVRFGYPIWLYVSVTGVIVYLLISPYY